MSPAPGRSLRLLAATFAGLALAGCAAGSSVETTFEQASVRLPVNVFGDYAEAVNAASVRAEALAREVRKRPQYAAVPLADLAAEIPGGVKLPLIVYFHGCGGILRASIGHLGWLSGLDDFVVIAPDSFARARPEYCFRDHTVDVNIVRQVGVLRRHEMEYALDRVVKLPWVDKRNIFLIGHSQGGGMVASYGGPTKIRGRILLNGACTRNSGGSGMADDEAVLTFDTGRDPWFRNYSTDCRRLVLNHPKGKSVWAARGTTHDSAISHWPTIKAFLTDNRR